MGLLMPDDVKESDEKPRKTPRKKPESKPTWENFREYWDNFGDPEALALRARLEKEAKEYVELSLQKRQKWLKETGRLDEDGNYKPVVTKEAK